MIIETRNEVTPENVQMLERVIDDLKKEVSALTDELLDERKHHEWAMLLKEESKKLTDEYDKLLAHKAEVNQAFDNLRHKHYTLIVDLLKVMNDVVKLETLECRNIVCGVLIKRLNLEHKT